MPLSRSVHQGFFGCRHFSKTNQLLARSSPLQPPIDWSLGKSIRSPSDTLSAAESEGFVPTADALVEESKDATLSVAEALQPLAGIGPPSCAAPQDTALLDEAVEMADVEVTEELVETAISRGVNKGSEAELTAELMGVGFGAQVGAQPSVPPGSVPHAEDTIPPLPDQKNPSTLPSATLPVRMGREWVPAAVGLIAAEETDVLKMDKALNGDFPDDAGGWRHGQQQNPTLQHQNHRRALSSTRPTPHYNLDESIDYLSDDDYFDDYDE